MIASLGIKKYLILFILKKIEILITSAQWKVG